MASLLNCKIFKSCPKDLKTEILDLKTSFLKNGYQLEAAEVTAVESLLSESEEMLADIDKQVLKNKQDYLDHLRENQKPNEEILDEDIPDNTVMEEDFEGEILDEDLEEGGNIDSDAYEILDEDTPPAAGKRQTGKKPTTTTPTERNLKDFSKAEKEAMLAKRKEEEKEGVEKALGEAEGRKNSMARKAAEKQQRAYEAENKLPKKRVIYPEWIPLTAEERKKVINAYYRGAIKALEENVNRSYPVGQIPEDSENKAMQESNKVEEEQRAARSTNATISTPSRTESNEDGREYAFGNEDSGEFTETDRKAKPKKTGKAARIVESIDAGIKRTGSISALIEDTLASLKPLASSWGAVNREDFAVAAAQDSQGVTIRTAAQQFNGIRLLHELIYKNNTGNAGKRYNLINNLVKGNIDDIFTATAQTVNESSDDKIINEFYEENADQIEKAAKLLLKSKMAPDAQEYMIEMLNELSEIMSVKDIISEILSQEKMTSASQLKNIPESLFDIQAYANTLNHEYYGQYANDVFIPDYRINQLITLFGEKNPDLVQTYYPVFRDLLTDHTKIYELVQKLKKSESIGQSQRLFENAFSTRDNDVPFNGDLFNLLFNVVEKNWIEEPLYIKSNRVVEETIKKVQKQKGESAYATDRDGYTTVISFVEEENKKEFNPDQASERLKKSVLFNKVGKKNFRALLEAIRSIGFEKDIPGAQRLTVTKIAQQMLKQNQISTEMKKFLQKELTANSIIKTKKTNSLSEAGRTYLINLVKAYNNAAYGKIPEGMTEDGYYALESVLQSMGYESGKKLNYNLLAKRLLKHPDTTTKFKDLINKSFEAGKVNEQVSKTISEDGAVIIQKMLKSVYLLDNSWINDPIDFDMQAEFIDEMSVVTDRRRLQFEEDKPELPVNKGREAIIPAKRPLKEDPDQRDIAYRGEWYNDLSALIDYAFRPNGLMERVSARKFAKFNVAKADLPKKIRNDLLKQRETFIELLERVYGANSFIKGDGAANTKYTGNHKESLKLIDFFIKTKINEDNIKAAQSLRGKILANPELTLENVESSEVVKELVELGREKDFKEADKKMRWELLDLRTDIASEHFSNNNHTLVNDFTDFENGQFKDLGWSKEEALKKFISVGENPVRFARLIDQQRLDNNIDVADALFAKSDDGDPAPVVRHIFGETVSKQLHDIFLSVGNSVDAESQTVGDKLLTLTPIERRKVTAAEKIYNHLLNNKSEDVDIATELEPYYSVIKDSIIFNKATKMGLYDVALYKAKKNTGTKVEPKRAFNSWAEANGLTGRTIGKLRNKVAQKFYESVAKSLGAELVVINDLGMRSQYRISPQGTPLVVVNIQDDNAFNNVFSHEIFHHILNKSSIRNADAFKQSLYDRVVNQKVFDLAVDRAIEQNPLLSLKGAEEEVMAEIFAKSLNDKQFYKDLVKLKGGSVVAANTLNKILDNVLAQESLHNTEGAFTFEGKRLINPENQEQLQNLILDLLGAVETEAELQSEQTKYHTPLLGRQSKESLEALAANKKNWLKGIWRAIFPKGTKGYVQIMNSLGEAIKKSIAYLAEKAPKFIYADFGSTAIEKRIADLVVHGAEELVTATGFRLEKHKAAFAGRNRAELEYLHDRIRKGLQVVLKDGEIQRHKDGTVKYKKVAALNFQEEADVKTALKEGIPQDIIDAFKDFQEIAEKQYKKLKRFVPDLAYDPNHYAQYVQWSGKGKVPVDERLDAVVKSISKLEGNTGFLEEKNRTRSIEEIRKGGRTYQTIDPIKMALAYVEATERMINTRKAIDVAMSMGLAKKFIDDHEAKKEQMYGVDDPAFSVLTEKDPATGFQLKVDDVLEEDIYDSEEAALAAASLLDANVELVKTSVNQKKTLSGWKIYLERKGELPKELSETISKERADEIVAQFMAKRTDPSHMFVVKPHFIMQSKPVSLEQVYFSKGLARMLRTTVAPDRFKNLNIFGVTGRQVLDWKHQLTAIEFAFSTFHLMTIIPEMTASTMTTRFRKATTLTGKVTALNPVAAMWEGFRSARETNALVRSVMANPELANDPRVKKLFDKYFGTKDADIQDVISMFFAQGGIIGQDADLRTSLYDHGKMKYLPVKKQLMFQDGEAYIGQEGHNTVKGIIKEVGGSFSRQYDEAIDQMPDNPMKEVFAGLKTAKYIGMQGMSEWLMEQTIPMVKMKVFMDEYTQNLKRHASDLEAGKITKHEIAWDVIKFTEDRFGEVNWKNNWMDPTLKSSLMFAFRSFTWFTGSWFALGKTGIDFAKAGWAVAKGDGKNVRLTEKGMWFLNAMFTHAVTSIAYSTLFALVSGGDDDFVEDDEDIPLFYRLMFPRYEAADPSKRLLIPGYPTEFIKIFHHLGFDGSEPEVTKMVTGRFSSVLSKSIEAYKGQDWRGVQITDEDRMLPHKAFDYASHILFTPPISVNTMISDFKKVGIDPKLPLMRIAGLTDSPAFAKRSRASIKLNKLKRGTFSENAVPIEKAENRDDVRKAAYKYAKGNKQPLLDMIPDKLTEKQAMNAISRYKIIDGQPNRFYVDYIIRDLKNASILHALEAWKVMTDSEKGRAKDAIINKYLNYQESKDHSDKEKDQATILFNNSGVEGF